MIQLVTAKYLKNSTQNFLNTRSIIVSPTCGTYSRLWEAYKGRPFMGSMHGENIDILDDAWLDESPPINKITPNME